MESQQFFGPCSARRGDAGLLQTFTRGAGLTDEERRVNHALKAARITIEKNYAMIGNIFRICQSTENFRLAKKRTIESLPLTYELLRLFKIFTII